MKNMSVAQRLVLSFGVLLVIFVVFGIFAEQSASKLGDVARSISERTELVSNSNNVALKIQQVRLDVFATKTAQTEEQKATAKQNLDKARADVDKAFDDYTAAKKATNFGSDAITQKALSELQAERDLWNKYSDVSKQSETSDDPNSTSNPEVLNAYNALLAAVLQDAENCKNDAHTIRDQGIATVSSVKTTIIIALLVVIALTVIVLVLIRRDINSSVQTILGGAKQLADGDLRVRIPIDKEDEFGRIAQSFNTMGENVDKMMKGVLSTATTVSDTSQQLTQNSEQAAQATQNVAETITNVASNAAEQLTSVEDTETSVNDLSASIDDAHGMIADMRTNIEDVTKRAGDGSARATKTAESMNEIVATVEHSSKIVEQLGRRSQEIGEIVSTISAIAEQTNLLALNAAIEAARAGENGRGFSVVAAEVGKLAEASQEATQKIASLISGIQEETAEAVEAMNSGRTQVEAGRDRVSKDAAGFGTILERINDCNQQADKIVATMDRLRDGMQEIVAATGSIGTSARGISDSSQSVSAATEEQAAGMEEIAASAHNLSDSAKSLKDSVAKFKV